MSRRHELRPTVYRGRRPSTLAGERPRGRDLDLTASEDGARLRRLFRPHEVEGVAA